MTWKFGLMMGLHPKAFSRRKEETKGEGHTDRGRVMETDSERSRRRLLPYFFP